MKAYGLESPFRLRKTLSKVARRGDDADLFVLSHLGPTLQESINHRITQTRNPKPVTLQAVEFGKGYDGQA